MILSTLRFAGYCWPHNPTKIYVDQKLVTDVETTFSEGERVVSAASGIKKVSGEGELVGKECIKEYKALEKLFESRRKGVLCLPGFEPFLAYFTKLTVRGESTPDVLFYTFEFVRDTVDIGVAPLYHTCKKGETLYDIAYDKGCDVDTLVRHNPSLRFPDELTEGMLLRIC